MHMLATGGLVLSLTALPSSEEPERKGAELQQRESDEKGGPRWLVSRHLLRPFQLQVGNGNWQLLDFLPNGFALPSSSEEDRMEKGQKKEEPGRKGQLQREGKADETGGSALPWLLGSCLWAPAWFLSLCFLSLSLFFSASKTRKRQEEEQIIRQKKRGITAKVAAEGGHINRRIHDGAE